MEAAECEPVTVDGFWTSAQTKTVKNKLQLYFGSKKKSGGGDCRVEAEDGAPRAAVFFSSEEVRQRVLARANHDIIVDNQTIQLRLTAGSHPANKDGVSDSQTPKSNAEAGNVSAENKDGSVQSVAVVLENVADDMSRDLLLMLVENISGLDDGCFSLEIIWESNRAAVTFSNAADVEKFLAVSQSSQKLQKHGLSARRLEAAESVRVESLPPTVVKDMLELYFEKNWALPDRIIMIPDEQAAIVTFKQPKVVENICTKRDYLMGSIPVRVYPYHESLGSALYGKERPAWKMPEPFTEKVHHVILKFLQMKKLSQDINDQMHPYFCSVDLNNNEVKLSPLPGFLRQKGLNAERVNRWMSTALDAFRQQMSQYTAFECAVSAAAWKAAEKDVRSVVREDAVLVMDASRDTVTVAGRADDMKQLRGPVEDIVCKAITQIKRQTEGVSEGMNVPPAMFYILKQEGLQKAAQHISPDMSLSYDEGSQMITITGLPAEVFQTKSWILEKKVGMSKKLIDVLPGLLDFLNTVDPMDMSQDLFTSQGITAIYGIEDRRVMLLGSSDRVLADAESKMKKVLSLQTLDVEDQEVLKRHDWKSLNKQLLDTYNSSKKKTVTIQIHPDRRNKITVAGFLTPVNEISSSLREFINYSQVQETVRVKSCAVVQFIDKIKSQDWKSIAKANDVKVQFDEVRPKILITGARVHVQKAKSCFLEMTGALSTDSFTVDKPGAKKYFLSAGHMVLSTMMSELSCVVMLRPENYEVEDFNSDFSDLEPTLTIPQLAGGRDAGASGPRRAEQTTAEGLKIVLWRGNIQDQTTDVIVNTISDTMNLNQGAVSKAILLAAGSSLQPAVNSAAGVAKLPFGKVVVTDGYNLMCRKVFHAVCPFWDDGAGQAEADLTSIIRTCLDEAEQRKMASLSFPAIGTGNLSFPRDVVSRVLLQEIHSYSRSRTPRHLREVAVVVHPSDSQTVDRFTRDFSGQTGRRVQQEEPEFNVSPVVQSVRQPQQNPVKITSRLPARGEERLNTDALVLKREEFEPTVFQLCADNDKAVSQTKRRIKDLIVAEQAKRTITDSFISHLSRADMDQLSALQRKLTVSIHLEAGQGDQEPKIHLEGLTRDVFTAESEVRDIIKKVERSENQRKQAFLVSGLVEWKHQQIDGTMAPFDIYTNLQLEEALGRKQSVKIQINNQSYIADVRLKKAVSANGRKEVELQRKDLKAADDAALPSNWDDMKGDHLKLFPLAAGSKEYSDVEKELRRTGLRVNIIKIERVQNISLWKSYQQVKTDLEVKNKHKNNERQLFHGTGPNSIDLINKRGFNRSYAGQHAAMYGNGAYFAVDPAYSAGGYAKPDARGQKRMYLARVLVGDYTQGRSGMIVPPGRNTGNAADPYDSVVDQTANPTMFIVFRDTQAYPEYLITFTGILL